MRYGSTVLLCLAVTASFVLPLSTLAYGQSASPPAERLPADVPHVVTLTAQQAKEREITVAPAAAGSADSTIRALATVRFDQDLVTKIGPMLPAKVVKVTKDIGDAVKPGDVVAILDSVALGKVKAQYLVVQAQFDLARENYEREKELVSKKISSRAELQQAKAEFEKARAELDSTAEELRVYGLSIHDIHAIRPGADRPFSRYALTTPQAGIVEKRNVTPGQTLTAEATPIEVVDPGRMWVIIDAFEKDVSRIRPGQVVTFRARAVPDLSFSGKVDWVGRELSPKTRTLPVRATVSNPQGVLRAGMFGTAEIVVGGAGRHALLPVGAVQIVDGRSIVFRPMPEKAGVYTVVPVTTGTEAAGRVEILSGIAPGEKVVTRGAFALMSILTAGTRKDTD